jgi:tRNA (guanine37-N1)-methyltransferase
MGVPCVRVPREEGETTRQRLAAADLVDDGYDITVSDGQLYIPVVDPTTVPDDLAVVTYDPPVRESQTMPGDLLPFAPSYERIGRLIIIDEADSERARQIADAIMDSDLPVDGVLNRASKIKGTERVRDWEVLAGETTEICHREYGCAFELDLADVYFSPRLATERHRVVTQTTADEQVFDMFAGVGPFVVPCAKRDAICVGTDINPTAIEYLRTNAAKNGVENHVTAIHGDVREIATEYTDWADRIVMNLPHSAEEFLETAVELAAEECTIHYYDIQPEPDIYEPGEQAIRTVAEPEYAVTVDTRRRVRSYAPGEYNVVLDVTLTRNSDNI